MAKYLDKTGLDLLVNNYLKPETEYSLTSVHPVQNKVLTQTLGNLLSIIDYSKSTGYFHYANAAALPTVNSTGQKEGDFEYNPEKELKIGQRAILDDTQAVMEISAIDSETGAITWTNTGLSFGGQVIQVNELPTASATEEDKIYQYVGVTTATLTNGFFYKCVSDGAVSPTYSWENINVSEGDTIQVEALPTAGASEVGKIYQYIGETNLSFTNGYFYECVEDSGSYSWVEKEVQKNANFIFTGTSSEWESESAKTDYQVAILTDKPTVNAVDSTDGSITVVANKHLVFKGTLEEWEALTTAEKKTYDEALITNDMDTGEVVNGVTDGDMRAVTSNAVYDYLTPTEISTTGTTVSQGSATIDYIDCMRSGNIVTIHGQLSEATLTNVSDTTTRLTLPNAIPAAVMLTTGAIGYWGGEVDEACYCHISNGRTLTIFSNIDGSPVSGVHVRFSVTYICK